MNDFLILNRDRHGVNIEAVMDRKGKITLAPLFDQGISLMFNCQNDEEIEAFDVLEDKVVQSFVGSHSTKENLKLIGNRDCLLKGFKEKDKEYIFEGIERILSLKHVEKMWEMIWKRWLYYESLFDL